MGIGKEVRVEILKIIDSKYFNTQIGNLRLQEVSYMYIVTQVFRERIQVRVHLMLTSDLFPVLPCYLCFFSKNEVSAMTKKKKGYETLGETFKDTQRQNIDQVNLELICLNQAWRPEACLPRLSLLLHLRSTGLQRAHNKTISPGTCKEKYDTHPVSQGVRVS